MWLRIRSCLAAGERGLGACMKIKNIYIYKKIFVLVSWKSWEGMDTKRGLGGGKRYTIVRG